MTIKSLLDHRFGVFPAHWRITAIIRLFSALMVLALVGTIGSSIFLAGGEMVGQGSSWKFEIETSGGLTGKGDGGVSVDSTGGVSASTKARTCQGQLTPEELKSFNRLIARARPGKWKKLYSRPGNPRGYADQFLYAAKLSITGAKSSKISQASWYDETQQTLPSDLSALVNTAWQARERAIASCKP